MSDYTFMSDHNLVSKAAARSPWLASPRVDSLFILSPPFFATLVALLLARTHADLSPIAPWAWLLLIVGVDVAHVYSTFFRTYLDPAERRSRPLLYLTLPIAAWLGAYLLYLYGALAFWRALAYLAVYHFVRQQYGFMMLYSRGRPQAKFSRFIDKAVIYLATGYPLLYWHTHLPRPFNWFVEDDFFAVPPAWLEPLRVAERGVFWLYLLAAAYYVWKELRQPASFNWPKNLLVFGTALSWYVGIIALQQDLTFTVINVVSHGIPYLALVWLVGRGDRSRPPQTLLARVFAPALIPVYLALLILCAYIEEGLWDGFIWREHATLFAWFTALPELTSAPMLALVVPTLALPQIMHYTLDGFIWRTRGPGGRWLKNLG